MPAFIKWRNLRIDSVAGPIVQIIFVFFKTIRINFKILLFELWYFFIIIPQNTKKIRPFQKVLPLYIPLYK